MKMKNKNARGFAGRRRGLAVLLAVCLVAALCPLSASALTSNAWGLDDLNTAIARAADGDVINLAMNINNVDKSIVIPAGKNVTINLGTYSILTKKTPYIPPGATEGALKWLDQLMENTPVIIVNSGATLTLTGGSGEVLNSCKGGIGITNLGTLILDGGKVSTNGENTTAIANSGTLTLNKGGITAKGSGSITVSNGSNFTMNGGTLALQNSSKGSAIANSGTVTITAGTITADSGGGYGISNNGGSVVMSGGSVVASGNNVCGLANEKGTVTLSGGYVRTTGTNTTVYNTGNFNMNGGSVEAAGYTSVAVECVGGAFVLSNGTIMATGSNAYGVLVTSGFTQTGGTITASGEGGQQIAYQAGVDPGAGTTNPAAIKAVPTPSTVLVDGTAVAFDSYNINGNNYFKLRDLAYELNGSAKQFSVVWSDSSRTVQLTNGKPYTVVGGEMAAKGTAAAAAVVSSHGVYINNVKVDVAAYNIGGNNYFKLRDLGAAMNFNVSWDGPGNRIIINTAEGYTAD